MRNRGRKREREREREEERCVREKSTIDVNVREEFSTTISML